MRYVAVRSVLCLSLLCAAPGVALAQKEKAPAAPAPKISKEARPALAAAQEALKKKDYATAAAKLTEAEALAKSNDDRFTIGSIRLDLGKAQNDTAMQAAGIEAVLDSGFLPAANVPMFSTAAGQLAYNNKDMAKADKYLTQAIASGSTDPGVYALLMEAKIGEKKPAEAIEVFEKAVAAKPGGVPVPQDWYARAIGVGYQAKLAPEVERVTRARVAAYPSPVNWRDALISYRELNKVDTQYSIDLMRLLRVVKGLKGQNDYLSYVEGVYQKLPGEASAVLAEGVASGDIVLATNMTAREFNDVVKTKVAGDKASLAAGATHAKGPSGTGPIALAMADAYFGYADYAPAIELYRVALAKGGADPNVVNTRLGAALALSGQADAARQAFGAVTGPRAGLAKYWLVWIDQQKA
jgi:tetratricopeptide (TPR) repeat protein